MTQGPPPLPPGLDLNFVLDTLLRRIGPLVAVVAIVVLGAHVLRWMVQSPVGEALAERIRGVGREGASAKGEDPARIAALEHEVERLHGQVAELAERVDFAERLLAERRERKLGAGP